MEPEFKVPGRILHRLVIAFVCDTAVDVVEGHLDYSPGGVVSLGDPAGIIFTWLWQEHRGLFQEAAAGLLVEVRRRQPASQQQMRFDDLADGLVGSFMPPFDEDEEVLDYLRTTLPTVLGAPLAP